MIITLQNDLGIDRGNVYTVEKELESFKKVEKSIGIVSNIENGWQGSQWFKRYCQD